MQQTGGPDEGPVVVNERICFVCDERPTEAPDGICPACRLKPKKAEPLGGRIQKAPVPGGARRRLTEDELEAWLLAEFGNKLFQGRR